MPLTSLSAFSRRALQTFLLLLLAAAGSTPLFAQGGEASLKLPDLHQATFLGGSISGPGRTQLTRTAWLRLPSSTARVRVSAGMAPFEMK